MPVTLINPFIVPAADADAFLATWSEAARAIQDAPGLISATLYSAQHAGAPFAFVNVALWESEDVYDAAFAASPIPAGAMLPEAAFPALYQVAKRVLPGPQGTVEIRKS